MRLSRLSAAVTAAAVSTAGLWLSVPAAGSSTTDAYQLNKVRTLDGSRMAVVRWNPCGPAISYRVNVRVMVGRAARSRAIREVKASVDQLARVSGLRFSYQGTTRAVPRSGNVNRLRTPLVVAFVRPGQTDYPLTGRAAGYGGVSYRLTTNRVEVTRGWVVIDHPDTRRMPRSLTARGVTRPNVIRHELGHAVGLQHVSRSGQLMYPTLHSGSPRSYAWGDRVGLTKVGLPAGCIL